MMRSKHTTKMINSWVLAPGFLHIYVQCAFSLAQFRFIITSASLSLSDMLILALWVWSTSQGHLKNEEAIREGENMEGGINTEGADASAFRECFSLAWKNPYVLRLAFSAGIGGLLFGYDTGLIWSLSLSHLPSLNIMKEKDRVISLSLSLSTCYLFQRNEEFQMIFCSVKRKKMSIDPDPTHPFGILLLKFGLNED